MSMIVAWPRDHEMTGTFGAGELQKKFIQVIHGDIGDRDLWCTSKLH